MSSKAPQEKAAPASRAVLQVGPNGSSRRGTSRSRHAAPTTRAASARGAGQNGRAGHAAVQHG